MKTKLAACLVVCCMILNAAALANTYYLSPSGNDSNSGLSVSQAWKTIQHLNTIDLQPGDSVLFQAGAFFTGNIYLDQSDAGTAAQPVYIGAYGAGKAIIDAGNGIGIQAYNCAGFHFSRLQINGSGVSTSTGAGIDFFMDLLFDLPFLKIDSCDVTGFRGYGIRIGCWDTNNGYTDVTVSHVKSFSNGSGGMISYGFNDVINHKNFHVSYSSFYDNKGRLDVTNTNTGNGIVLSAIDNAVIEYCEAYNNGENNTNPSGGPVGMWFYLVRNGVIQFCESHHNRTATIDGGGFDIDGGSQNCIIQYCYSHDNDGAGYLLAEYGAGVAYTGNVIRYNITQNDARRGSSGAIAFWGVDNSHRVQQTQVYNNTVYVNDVDVVSGIPAAVKLMGNSFAGVKLANNIFYTTGNAVMLRADMNVDSNMLHFIANDYYATNGQPVFLWAGNTYNGLAQWKSATVTQERRGLQHYGVSIDPLLGAPGAGGTVGLAQLQQMPSVLAGYKLQQGSVIPDAGINISAAFGSGIGSRDFFANVPLQNASQEIGAHECHDCFLLLPENVVSIAAKRVNNFVSVSWQVTDPASVQAYILEHSDGGPFTEVRSVQANAQRRYSVDDILLGESKKYYRVLVVQKNGRRYYSKIVVLADVQEKVFDVVPVSASQGMKFMISSEQSQRVEFYFFNASGQLLAKEGRMLAEGISYQSFYIKDSRFMKAVTSSGKAKTVLLPVQ
jgi:hypothetical protein